MKPQNYESFITSILKDIHPDLQLSGDVVLSLNKIVHILLSKILMHSDECNNSFTDKKEKFTSKIAETAVLLTFPEGSLSVELVQKADEAVMKYRAFTLDAIVSSVKGAGGTERTTQAHKAGLIIPPSRVRHDIEREIHTFSQIGEDTPIFLAGILNGFIRNILMYAGYEVINHKKKRITVRDMRISIGNKPELQEVISQHHIILPGGVMPCIDDSLLA